MALLKNLHKLPNPFFQTLDALLRPEAYPTWAEDPADYFWKFTRWQLNALVGDMVMGEGSETVTVILLSYARVRNMQPLVRSLLKAAFVKRIILSNNNPRYRISDWVTLRDPRLELIDQPEPTPPGIRFELARQEEAPYFITLDDDLFLYPAQLKKLFTGLVRHPGVPHGVQGENYEGRAIDNSIAGSQGWRAGMKSTGGPVDVLNRAYAFTRAHLNEMYRLAGLLGVEVPRLRNGEDILLSFCGDGRPLCEDVGPLLSCLTTDQPGVATWTQKDFFTQRSELYQRLWGLKARAQ